MKDYIKRKRVDCCIKLNQSRRSRKATTGQPATSCDRPAASHQPPAAAASRLHTIGRQLPSHLKVELSCFEFVYKQQAKLMLFCVGDNREKHQRERERACIKLFVFVSYLFLVIKLCVLSPPSVSRPPQVVSPTNIDYALFMNFLFLKKASDQLHSIS